MSGFIPSADWMIHPLGVLAFKGAILLLLGLILARAFAGHPAAVRHRILGCALFSVLLLPVVGVLAPPLELSIPGFEQPEPRPRAPFPPGAELEPAATGLEPAPDGPATMRGTRPVVAANVVDWRGILALLYLAGVAIVLGFALGGVLRARAVTRRAEELDARSPWRPPIRELAPARGNGRLRLVCSETIPVPFTWGVFRPVIVMPAGSKSWSPQQRGQALLHELTHVRRGDWAVQMMALVACALHWFNPLIWLTRRRLLLEAERACDDTVLLSGAPVSDYAEQLLGLARHARSFPTSVPGVTMARDSQLSVRLRSILDPEARRIPMTRSKLLSIGLLAVAPVLFVAPATLVPAGSSTSSISVDDGTPLLLRAILEGDLESTRTLLAGGANPDASFRGWGTPLIVAASTGDARIVALLVEHGADVNGVAADRKRSSQLLRSPLTTAAHGGHADVVELLLREGASVEATPSGDATALIEACKGGFRDVVDILLDHGADVNHVVRGDGSPLIAAADGGHVAIVERLLDAGADPNTTVRGDGSPLIAAARSGSRETTRLLIDHGADPDVFVRGDESPLYHAASRGDTDVIRDLIDAGVDVTAEMPGDGNALIVAARNGHSEAAELLLAAGARADDGVPGDGNALIMAAAHGDSRMVRRMIDSGADVNRGVPGDGNPLIVAARGGHLDVVRLLVDEGADVERIVPGDENALIQAAGAGHLDVVRYLVELGADVNVRIRVDRGEVRTALNQAVRYRHDDVADYLVAHGAVE